MIGDRNIRECATCRGQEAAAALGSGRAARVDTAVPDTTSGSALHARGGAAHDDRFGFSYTLESIIQAGKRRMAIGHVEIATNAHTRPSRLFDSIFGYIKRSARDDRADLHDVRTAEGLHLHRRVVFLAGSARRFVSSTTI
jgi:hypothetical protein